MPRRVLRRSLACTNAFALVKGARHARRAGKHEQGCERVLRKQLFKQCTGFEQSGRACCEDSMCNYVVVRCPMGVFVRERR
jgi:hypothetical protein